MKGRWSKTRRERYEAGACPFCGGLTMRHFKIAAGWESRCTICAAQTNYWTEGWEWHSTTGAWLPCY